MITLELEASYPDEAAARAVLAALGPDNAGYVRSELRGRSIVFTCSSESAGTLKNTADDLMACVKAAEEAAGAASARLRHHDYLRYTNRYTFE